MSIVSTAVLMNTDFGAGRKFWRIQYNFHDGKKMVLDSAVPEATDINDWIAARTPELEAQMAETEALQVLEP